MSAPERMDVEAWRACSRASRAPHISHSREELVAEMGAAFLCGIAGIDNDTVEQSAAYIKGWLGAIKADPRALVIAAAQAQKAADYILGAQAGAQADAAEVTEVAA